MEQVTFWDNTEQITLCGNTEQATFCDNTFIVKRDQDQERERESNLCLGIATGISS